jgi:hypothetical protein
VASGRGFSEDHVWFEAWWMVANLKSSFPKQRKSQKHGEQQQQAPRH